MPASVKGGIALRKSLRAFSPDLAKALPKEVAAALKPITKAAKVNATKRTAKKK